MSLRDLPIEQAWVYKPNPEDIIILRMDLSGPEYERVAHQLKQAWPDNRIVVLHRDAKLDVLNHA